MFEVLVTCPPMLGMLEEFLDHGEDRGLRLVAARDHPGTFHGRIVLAAPGLRRLDHR